MIFSCPQCGRDKGVTHGDQVFGKELCEDCEVNMLDHKNYANIRPDTLASLDRYVTKGIPPGGFLEAVLSDKLFEAFMRADNGNRETLFEICTYVYNELPSRCHGSPEKVREWLKIKQGERDEIQNNNDRR